MELLLQAALATVTELLKDPDPEVRLAAAMQIIGSLETVTMAQATLADVAATRAEELLTEEQVSGETPAEVERRLAAQQAEQEGGGHRSGANGGLGRAKRR